MNWLQMLQLQQQSEVKQLSTLSKLKKFTLYEHNSATHINQQRQEFTCILNSKKINSQHSIIGKIKGSLKTNTVTITNTLTDNEVLLGGKWQYQKIQLTRFAFRYNERAHNNILVKVNPINGEVVVGMSFSINSELFQKEYVFREIVTDYCQVLGEEAEKVFNTMMQIICQREANEPYLKSGIKINPNFPRYMKAEKLLDKVKSLIATSSFYKIRADTSSAHKNRSYFKKIFLANEKKYIKNSQMQKLGLLYQPKYNRTYQQQMRKQSQPQPKDYIRDYTQLQQKNQVQFAKHLHESLPLPEPISTPISISQVLDPPNPAQLRKIIVTSTRQQLRVLVDQLGEDEDGHLWEILDRLQNRHGNIVRYYLDQKYPKVRVTDGYDSQGLQMFLDSNRSTISLSTKFDIMAQICQALQFMHAKFVGCFFRMQDFLVDRNFKVKLRNLAYSYAVNQKTGWKDARHTNVQDINTGVKLDVQYQKQPIEFPFIDISGGLQTIINGDKKVVLHTQKCDIFSLGMVLYGVLMDKYPFLIDSILQQREKMSEQECAYKWCQLWTVQTQYFLSQGGQITKLVAHLLLKCFNTVDLTSRPYVQWLTVILSQIKTSMNGLY